MALLRRLFLTRVGPDALGPRVIQPLMTGVGLFVLLAGAIYLPVLNPNRVEMVMVMLLLLAVALLCHAVGLLTVIAERAESERRPRP